MSAANPSSPNAVTWAQCFASGQVRIPTARWNPIAAALVHKYVLPANETLGGVAYSNFNAQNTNAQDQGKVRLDWTPTAADSVWVSSIFQSSPGTMDLTFTGASFPGFGTLQASHYKLFAASWTHTFNANMLNELRGSYFRNPFGSLMPAQVVAPSSAGFSITPQDPASGLPSRFVELRIEAFNAFNHANFANPGGNFLSGSFGRVTSVVHSADPNSDPSPGRAIQLAAKFYF